MVLACLSGVLTACGGGTGAASHSSATRPATTTSTASLPAATTRTAIASTLRAPRRHRRRRARDPGTLPQTHQLPSAHTAVFQAEMRSLWVAIRTDSVRAARPAFFPEAAYRQVKAIADPAADYAGRLLGDLGLDLAAAHALLGATPGHARLLAVRVPAGYAHWVAPNVCLNRVGYYEVPNARLVYAESGQTRSLGIASMISWRGVWYVVHLGAVVRHAAVGIVDAPSSGGGISTPSSTC